MIPKKFDDLKRAGELPTPSGVGTRILSLTQEEDWSVDELIETLRADPALTGQLIRLANSAASGAIQPVATVRDAAMRLGARTIANIALGFTLISANQSGRCAAFGYDKYWANVLARAVAGQLLSRTTRLGDPTQAFTCALLSRVGELALASVHPTRYSQLLQRCQQNPDLDLLALETEHFDIEHHEVCRSLLLDWGMPSTVCDAVGLFAYSDAAERTDDRRGHELMRILRWAEVVAAFFTCEPEGRILHWAEIERMSGEFGLESDDLVELCDEIGEQWREWGKQLAITALKPPCAASVRREARRAEGSSRTSDGESTAEKRKLEAETTEQTESSGESPSYVDSKGAYRLRTLAVDDDGTSLLALSQVLATAGCEVFAAGDGAEALSLALRHRVQLIVSSWDMPEKDGIGLCRALRQSPLGRSIYFVLVSARDGEDDIVHAFDAGVDDYVTKPFRSRLLQARVQAGRRVIALQEELKKEKKAQRAQTAELALMARKLERTALTDALTELPNRRYGLQRLGDEWELWVRKGRVLSIIALDIDHFKRINDTYGHDTGDAVLKETAAAMQRTTRRTDVIARMGGEEFLLICPDSRLADAKLAAERFRRTIEENRIRYGNFDGNVTVSLGVAEVTDAVPHMDGLLKKADEAVYHAKTNGRNRVSCA